ncbi:flagellar protein FlgN [Mesobacillus maritimus]|uniref:flagellar protein FlgN n=1 Tax=Mesobacillus maritimus TaxID=1643336 RepID=UPI00384CF13C
MLDLIGHTLEEMINIQKQLINYSEQKKTVLIERKVAELNPIIQEEAKLVKQLGLVEHERKQQVEMALQEHPSLSFSQFIETLQDDERSRKLSSQLDTLRKLSVELQAKNRGNEQLLKDSLNFAQYMIDHLTHSKQRHFNYQSPLSPQNTHTTGHGFFDTKA